METSTLLQDAEFVRQTIEHLQRHFAKSIERKAEEQGITEPQMRVMTEVVARPGVSIKEISSDLAMTQSTVSGVVERLINKGILSKRSNSRDKRAVQVFPTEAVVQFLQQDRLEFVNEAVLAALDRLTPAEQALVIQGLHLLAAAADPEQRTVPTQPTVSPPNSEA
ncbi:MarR-type HTH domain protein [Acididesulfobacillus acetoxydans]|uniref:Helix_turn_helix multiple antibiotic resistance protein n=1 Tax=Acididesulfobacillus acetoxydans TaxID=1561005 RepID=A0A8S0WZX8_9FIRM|nr:MarR family transcriptional regulator [Acididesulfobacillus acetoxydans]CAA7602231.1 MarR-type HTH domain protein [Acididesulfobacillus acetoxydans]CEJ07551.1 helix_turn_helix multiple antibiotic resistance protein [Acididesulfobacillus acetoxydans]